MKFNQIAADHGRSILRHGLLISLIFILMSPVASQSPPPPESDPNNLTGDFNPSMGVIVIVLIAALFFMGFFSIYIRHCSDDDSSVSNTRRISAVRSRRGAPRGLDASVIESFPTFDYSAVKTLKIGKGALECAVCLNEFEDDETLRLIPKCDHVFHPECIDAWLAAHTTCPVCRANLAPGESVHALELGQISEAHQAHEEGGEDQIIGAENQNDDVVIDVVGQPVGPTGPVQCGDAESMEQPLNSSLSRLNRNRTRRNISGRPRWFGKFSRSNSTGHVAVKQWENMERFTLRLPEEVRRQIMSGKLSRTTSCVVLPREGSSRRGNRTVLTGEGSNRGRLFGSERFDRPGRSDRWVFSLTPPFFSRAPSLKSPKMTASAGGSLHSTKAADSVHAVAEPKLPPV